MASTAAEEAEDAAPDGLNDLSAMSMAQSGYLAVELHLDVVCASIGVKRVHQLDLKLSAYSSIRILKKF